MIHWYDLHHSALSAGQLYALLKLRSEVFVVEQRCLYQDIDGEDLKGESRHIFGLSKGELVACARLLHSEDPAAPLVIGRVVVSSRWRGCKTGEALMQVVLTACSRHWPEKAIYLSAQAYLTAFYARLGFQVVTPVYEEDGIPHQGMAKQAL